MSKRQHGNKEARKPKKVPAAQAPLSPSDGLPAIGPAAARQKRK